MRIIPAPALLIAAIPLFFFLDFPHLAFSLGNEPVGQKMFTSGLLKCPHAMNAARPLDLDLEFGGDTTDNQAVHPDVIYFPSGFGPDKGDTVVGINAENDIDTIIADTSTPRWFYWMVFTPYPYGAISYENPTIRVSNAKDSGWIRPFAIGHNLKNPIDIIDTIWVPDPIYMDPNFPAHGHSADPEFVYDSTKSLLGVFFLSTSNLTMKNYIVGLFSPDGISWNRNDTIQITYSDIDADNPWPAWNLVSPTVSENGRGGYYLWFVDDIGPGKGTQLLRLSTDRIDTAWGNPDSCTIVAPHRKKQIWHIKVRRSPFDSLYYMMATMNAKSSANIDTMGQYLYASPTGLNWELVGEALPHGRLEDWDYVVYRSTFLFGGTDSAWTMPLWYSAADSFKVLSDMVWGIGYTNVKLASPPGDVDDDGTISSNDLLYLIKYIYSYGDPPRYLKAADVDRNGRTNALDAVYLMDYLYLGGPPPKCR